MFQEREHRPTPSTALNESEDRRAPIQGVGHVHDDDVDDDLKSRSMTTSSRSPHQLLPAAVAEIHGVSPERCRDGGRHVASPFVVPCARQEWQCWALGMAGCCSIQNACTAKPESADDN
ncbi:unnamed protein product [Lampetra planeri]